MALDSAKKAEIIAKYGRNENDTGSSEVQIALLTTRIAELTEHLKVFKKESCITSWTIKTCWSTSSSYEILQKNKQRRLPSSC